MEQWHPKVLPILDPPHPFSGVTRVMLLGLAMLKGCFFVSKLPSILRPEFVYTYSHEDTPISISISISIWRVCALFRGQLFTEFNGVCL